MIDIRRLVSRQALWCILPAPTDRLFARYREHSFVRMVLGSWPLLIMALVLAGWRAHPHTKYAPRKCLRPP